MKKFCVSLFALFVCMIATAQELQPMPIDSAVRVGKLPNGLTYYIRHNETPKQRAEFHIAQAVGAILEEDSQNGLAHFLEHMAFNGTQHFEGKGIINYFESIGVNFGGNINAYTSIDQTVYRLSDVPTIREGIIDSALLVLHDWSCALLLEDDEIDAERGVIREEWRTRMNSASRRMWSESQKQKFPNSQYAKRDVIGDTAVINNFPYQVLRDYYHKWYGPDLQGIIVVGDIDVDQVEAKIKKLWADVPARANRGERPYYTIDDNAEPIVSIVLDKEGQQSMIEIDYKHEPLPQAIRTSVTAYQISILNTLISSMIAERFNDLANKPDANFIAGGASYGELVKTKDCFEFIVIPKEGKEKAAYADLLYQQEKIDRYGFTNAELERAKTNMLSSYEKSYNERANQRNISYTNEYIRNFLSQEPIPGIEWEYNFVKSLLPYVTVDILNEIVKQYITDENIIIAFQGPDKPEVVFPTREEAVQMLRATDQLAIEAPKEESFDQPLVKKTPKAGKIKKRTENKQLGTTEWLLSNGVRVVFKPTKFKSDEILFDACSQGGLSLIDNVDDLPSAYLATDIVAQAGLGDFSITDLQKILTGKHVSISASINSLSEGIEGSSNVADFETLLQLAYLQFTGIRRDDESYQTLMSLCENVVVNRYNNIKNVFSDSVSLFRTSHSPRTLIFNQELLKKVDQEKATDIFRMRFANPADFTFIFTGNIDPNDKNTQKLILTWIGGLKTTKARETFKDQGVRSPLGMQKNYFAIPMTIRTASNRIEYTSYDMPYSRLKSMTLDVISRCLDMRYLESIREKEGGSYGVGTSGYLSKRPVAEAKLIMQFDTDPEKQARLMEIIHQEVQEMAQNGPRPEDLQKAKESMLKDFEENIEKNSYWQNAVLYHYYLWGEEGYTTYRENVNSITAESVKQVLNELLQAGNVFEVVMYPENEK
ncbi:MAG: insulinase family protein [Paludibacteraceae bacterium]|nr:insulinase family protein [Paludibacteraceae bacterium]